MWKTREISKTFSTEILNADTFRKVHHLPVVYLTITIRVKHGECQHQVILVLRLWDQETAHQNDEFPHVQTPVKVKINLSFQDIYLSKKDLCYCNIKVLYHHYIFFIWVLAETPQNITKDL